MKAYLTILVLAVGVAVGRTADTPTDLTGADASRFQLEVGHTVSLRGRLDFGGLGLRLLGATATNVVFYVVPDMPAHGTYSYPETLTIPMLTHQQVRITGELKFQAFDRSKAGPGWIIPPDYYYTVLQRTTIEPIESK